VPSALLEAEHELKIGILQPGRNSRFPAVRRGCFQRLADRIQPIFVFFGLIELGFLMQVELDRGRQPSTHRHGRRAASWFCFSFPACLLGGLRPCGAARIPGFCRAARVLGGFGPLSGLCFYGQAWVLHSHVLDYLYFCGAGAAVRGLCFSGYTCVVEGTTPLLGDLRSRDAARFRGVCFCGAARGFSVLCFYR
jgi:hypothetical protein